MIRAELLEGWHHAGDVHGGGAHVRAATPGAEVEVHVGNAYFLG